MTQVLVKSWEISAPGGNLHRLREGSHQRRDKRSSDQISFENAIQNLQTTDQSDIPDTLTSVASTGVAPLAELQGSIADAARNALDAARAADDTGTVGAFFERRFGGRSIVPREGSDPDAVLSRVEAAVRAGDLETALSESTALPEEAQSALGSWLEQAQQRHEAVKAADALAQRLSAL